MKYKAIFFDRDGTLTYYVQEKINWRDRIIEEWSGKSFELPYDKMIMLFNKAKENRPYKYKNLEDEKEFFQRYYKYLLIEEGVTEKVEERAKLLFDELWCNGDRALYSETIEVLEYFKNKGFKIGVISDTSPSLQYSLEQLGIDKYFDSFIASSLVGAGKPSPIIFNVALDSVGVKAEESLYVDDYKPEADGAREQGFTSFLIDRNLKEKKEWEISNLKEIIDFVEKLEK